MNNRELAISQTLKPKFEKAGKEYGVDPTLLAAVASRESNTGIALDKNGFGDKGNAYGIMQIDKRHHNVDTSVAPDSQANIDQGARILKQSIDGVSKKHPDWSKDYQVRGGVAAYNFGVKNVQTKEGIDRGTTGGNYSRDVLDRQARIKKSY